MEKTTRKERFIRIMIPIIILAMAIWLFRSGYQAGHWLYRILHK